MSQIARWSYKAIAIVKPIIDRGEYGEASYGAEYEIFCTYIAESKQGVSNGGEEFTSNHVIFTEDSRPKYMDLIKLPELETFEEIKLRNVYDMNMFNDVADFKLTTGAS